MMRFIVFVIVCICILNKTLGIIINKRLMQKIIDSRIPVINNPPHTDKCGKKKTLGEVKIEDFNKHFKETSKKYGDIDYSKHNEIVMDFRTIFVENIL